MKIDHIINPVHVSESSDLFVAQPITFESMRIAKNEANEGLDIQLLTTQYAEDHQVIPPGFTILPDLDRSVLDLETFRVARKLPILDDIFSKLHATSKADYWVYSNVDIGLMPDFYNHIHQYMLAGYDAFTITRRDLSDHYDQSEQLQQIYQDIGKKHAGYDTFVFKRSLYESFRLGEICIGVPLVGASLLMNMVAVASKPHVFRAKHLTFHIGGDYVYRKPEYRDYIRFNEHQFLISYKHLCMEGGHKKIKQFFMSNQVKQIRLKKLILRPRGSYYQQFRSIAPVKKDLDAWQYRINSALYRKKSERRLQRQQQKILSSRANEFLMCITFPRSGHHLLVNCLFKYFSKNLNFPKTDGRNTDYQCVDVIRAGDIVYCGASPHCQYVGCTHPDTNFQKNHDFVLQSPQPANIKYIIQIRHPLESLVSWYTHFFRYHTSSTFAEILPKHLNKWKSFVHKWLLSDHAKALTSHVIRYNDMITKPHRTLSDAIEFIRPNHDVDVDFLHGVIDIMEIEQKNQLFTSSFFDKELFQWAEKQVAHEIDQLQIPHHFK